MYKSDKSSKDEVQSVSNDGYSVTYKTTSKKDETKTPDEDTVYHAEKHKGCTIAPQSVGGFSYVDMTIDINLSNDKIFYYDVSDAVVGKTFATTDVGGKPYIQAFLKLLHLLLKIK